MMNSMWHRAAAKITVSGAKSIVNVGEEILSRA